MNKTTRSISTHLLAAAAAMLGGVQLGGCAIAPERSFVEASEKMAFETVGPDFKDYVLADPALSPDEKQTRIDNLEAYQGAVRQARKNLDGPTSGRSP